MSHRSVQGLLLRIAVKDVVQRLGELNKLSLRLKNKIM